MPFSLSLEDYQPENDLQRGQSIPHVVRVPEKLWESH